MPASIFVGTAIKDLMLRLMAFEKNAKSQRNVCDIFAGMLTGKPEADWIGKPELQELFCDYLIAGAEQFLESFKNRDRLVSQAAELQKWHQGFKRNILGNLASMQAILGPWIEHVSPIQAGFNIFVRLRKIGSLEDRQFVLLAYKEAGIELLPGPVFGLRRIDYELPLCYAMKASNN
jgi:hypothetical protein